MRLIDIEDTELMKTVADGHLSAKALWRRINAQPTIDAVPVVRCKDCNYFTEQLLVGDNNYNYCYLYDAHRGQGEYCSRAERKEE